MIQRQHDGYGSIILTAAQMFYDERLPTVGDLDLDGRVDLVIANAASGSVSVMLNAGAVTFRPAIRVDLDNTPPRKTYALVLADLNGDGWLDIATANAGTSDLSLVFRVTG